MRKKLLAGNWKMNKDIHETASFIADLKERLKDFKGGANILICPPFTSLLVAGSLLKGSPLSLGAQNMSQFDEGAYTGEVAGRMLVAAGCAYVILGHSERRQYFLETDATVNLKAKKALSLGIAPILCVGESLQEREQGLTDRVVSTQIKGVLRDIMPAEMEKVIIAYEPVWAIGTGKNATPEQANQVHRLIRKIIGQAYNWALAERITILYGGSMNASNAPALLSSSDIDGGLIGGASLKPEVFMSIIQAGVEAKISSNP